MSGQAQIERERLVAADGAHGIVFGARASGSSHVWNAFVEGDQVNFWDFQAGRQASFSGYSLFAFIRTS